MVHPRTAAVALLLLGASLARAATVAGVLPGALAVEPSGAASYAIPIEVPPGTAGMAPSLSLVYNSQGGNGLLGVGWSLGGLSSITRCPRTPAQDSARGAIGYDTDDRFCLDGQRLVAVSGTYGGDGTEYRTEIDTFAQVYSYGSAGTGPAWFEVRTKSGQTMEYGKTADARIEAVGKSEARQWALSRVTDTVGNYLTVSYREEDGQGYPSRMDYTGYMTSGTPYASVRFEYGSRHDIRLFSSGGSRVRVDERLTKVKTYVGATLVGEYRLTYASAGLPQPSRVVKVERCDRSGHCLPATDYTWSDLGDGTFHPPRWSTPRNSAGWSNYKSVVGDFNGDGLADLAWTNQGNSGLRVDVSLSNAPSDSGRIASITSATGPSFTLDYAPLTEGGSFYAKDTGDDACALPCIDLQTALYAVKEVTRDYGFGAYPPHDLSLRRGERERRGPGVPGLSVDGGDRCFDGGLDLDGVPPGLPLHRAGQGEQPVSYQRHGAGG